MQAYRFELDPSNAVGGALESHAGAARFAFNWGLAVVESRLEARRVLTGLAIRQGASVAEASSWAAGRVGPVPGTLPALRREWNRAKDEVAPWWRENSKEAYSSGLDALARALKNYFDSCGGRRRGRRVGWPKPKRRHGGRRSFRVTTGSFGVVDARHVRLPRIGVIRTKEATTSLVDRLGAGTARVLAATVSERAGRWWVSFTCQVERAEPTPAQRPTVVGVDLGVGHLAVLSTGEMIPNPKSLSKHQRRMARLQRQCSRRRGPAKGRRPSKRWQRSRAALARTHRQVAHARVDGLHKLTTALAARHGTIVVEDLDVAGMTASAKGSGRWRGKAGLNRAILDAAFGQLRRQLAYKSVWFGSRLIVADRWYPSSKTCSGCKAVKAKLPRTQRSFRCGCCGLVIDRDINAAINLASLVEAVGTASGAGTGRNPLPANAQGEERFMPTGRCSSTNCEDGTGPTRPGKTATAAEQSTAA
ncbi:MAG: IS607 family element RNA-guided endonuclease TnpB [Acidimicrobiia bacterium]